MPRHAQIGVDAPVHELQELGGELDVADAAGSSLDVAVGTTTTLGVRLGPHLEGTNMAQIVGPEGHVPDHVRGGRGPGPAQLEISAHRDGLQERLPLPGLRPSLPVRLVGLEAPDERTVPTLGPQVEVHPEAPTGRVDQAPPCPRQALGVTVAHQHHVDVAGVVELGATELAHADHGQSVVGSEELARRSVGVLEHGRGHRRKLSGDELDGGGARSGRAPRSAGAHGASTRPSPRGQPSEADPRPRQG